MKLLGEKTLLKPLELNDIPNCWRWIHDKKVIRYLQGPFPKTYAGEVAWFRKMQKQKSERLFGVFDKEKGVHIGTLGIHNISKEHRKANIGIMFGEKSCWGKGFGSDALKTALTYCFQKLRLNKVSLIVDPLHDRAQKCYEKCGFKRVGFLKDDAFVRGRWRDSIVMEVFANRK